MSHWALKNMNFITQHQIEHGLILLIKLAQDGQKSCAFHL